MNSPPQLQNRIELPHGFEIITHPSHPERTEIVRNGKKYDLLTAYPDHPYCEKAENFFHDIFVKGGFSTATSRMHSNQRVTLYLRDRETFLVEPIEVIADIAQKFTGVKSGMITHPEELAGIMCCPPKDPKGSWIGFRNFDKNYLNSGTGQTPGKHRRTPHIIPPHITHLPNIRPEKNLAAALTDKERRDINFAELPPNIVLAGKEFREYFIYSSFIIMSDDEPYQVKDISKGSGEEGDAYYIKCKSLYAWRKLEDVNELDFARSTMDDSGKGYFEVIRGSVRTMEGKLQFTPEKAPSKPGLQSHEVFRIRSNPLKDGLRHTRQSVSITF